MKLYFNFDLADWLGRRQSGTPATILVMISRLPEESMFLASAVSEFGDEAKEDKMDPAALKIVERQTWTTDRILMAELANRLGAIIQYTGRSAGFEIDPPPPRIGPGVEASERVQEDSQAARPGQTIDDIMAMVTGTRRS